MDYFPLSEKVENVAKKVVNAAYLVHKTLGPGLLEHVYELCFCHEIEKAGLNVKRQVPIPIVYDDINLGVFLRLDVLVEDFVICEQKAVELMHPIFEAQLLTHLKLSKKRLGFLINFNVIRIKDGIKRMIL